MDIRGRTLCLITTLVCVVNGTASWSQTYNPTASDPVSNNTAGGTGATRDTGLIGLGGSIRVMSTLYLVAEVSPRIGGYVIGDAVYGFGIAKRIGGHVFDLTFTNTTQGTTFAQIARGGFPDSLYLGFNLTRKFF